MAASYRTGTGPSLDDTEDFENADRGFVASMQPCIVRNKQGTTVWNGNDFDFVQQSPCPASVDAGLWRQAQLLSKQGLYRITQSIYQVRGFDISHITFVEGVQGVIVIDPLVSCECAEAAYDLYRRHRGSRSVRAMVYTHSHIDHFGGALGVLPDGYDPASTSIPIVAPEGFLEEAVSENVFAGPAMRTRAAHMYGAFLPRSTTGQVGVGLGMGTSRGRTSLVPPNVLIKHTSQTLEIDGVQIVFQMVPNTEAPAEMNMYFPQQRALLIAECATHSMHNISTLRGALVRDCKAWGRHLDETLQLFVEQAPCDVQFASHGWPTWGSAKVKAFVAEQRDLYLYMHDQTVRSMNQGLNGTEIAEQVQLPPSLACRWHAQGFYGSLSHNVKAIYQRYLTWFDGSAENLWKWPPAEEGQRYVECMGGPASVIAKAEEYIRAGDLRFAATLLGHLVASRQKLGRSANDCDRGAALLADVFQKLGFGSQNATWRNFYLSQAEELRRSRRGRRAPSSVLSNISYDLPLEDWLAGLSVSIDGRKAGQLGRSADVILEVTDVSEMWRLLLSNAALTYRKVNPSAVHDQLPCDVSVRATKKDLQDVLTSKTHADKLESRHGDITHFVAFLALADIHGPGDRASRL